MIEPLRKELRVRAKQTDAFRRFTEEVASWWPRASHSVSEGSCVHVEMEGRVGGRFFERAEDGAEHVWGTVVAWDPPSRVSFTWHPGRDAVTGQVVEVVFTGEGQDTVVVLTHTGWESLGDAGPEMRERYDGGWDLVLGRYREVLIG